VTVVMEAMVVMAVAVSTRIQAAVEVTTATEETMGIPTAALVISHLVLPSTNIGTITTTIITMGGSGQILPNIDVVEILLTGMTSKGGS